MPGDKSKKPPSGFFSGSEVDRKSNIGDASSAMNSARDSQSINAFLDSFEPFVPEPFAPEETVQPKPIELNHPRSTAHESDPFTQAFSDEFQAALSPFLDPNAQQELLRETAAAKRGVSIEKSVHPPEPDPIPFNQLVSAPSSFLLAAAEPSTHAPPPSNTIPPAAPPQVQPASHALFTETSSAIPVFSSPSTFEASTSQAMARPARVGTDPVTESMPEDRDEAIRRLREIVVTTTDSVQGRVVEQYLDLVASEAVVPIPRLLEGDAPVGKFNRLKAGQARLRAIRQLLIAELKMDALRIGANAVLGVRLGWTQIDAATLLVSASGTAARIQ